MQEVRFSKRATHDVMCEVQLRCLSINRGYLGSGGSVLPPTGSCAVNCVLHRQSPQSATS